MTQRIKVHRLAFMYNNYFERMKKKFKINLSLNN